MRFTIASSDLKDQLQVINGATATNSTLPILEGFLFKIENNNLTLAASDSETFMTAQIDVESQASGSVAIPAKLLLDTLKQLPSQPLSFEVDAETFAVSMTSAYGKYELAGEDGADFPRLPQPDETMSVKIPAALLLDGINKTLFATSSDEAKLAMTGVYMLIDPQGLTFVSTDSHKLVKYTFSEITHDNTASFILPKKALSLLKNALSNSNQEVEISFNKSSAFFSFGHQVLVCRLIDARYPDYTVVIPHNNPNVLTISRPDFLNSLKRISNYANKITNQVKLVLEDGQLTIEAEDPDYSNKAVERQSCGYEGEPLTIGFNAKFLIDMLNVIGGDQVRLELSTPNRAGLLRPEVPEPSEDLLMLVMPLMLGY